MKLKIVSDLHLDVSNHKKFSGRNIIKSISEGDYDVLVIAGDVCESSKTSKFAKYLREIIPADKKIIWVPGNHCFWGMVLLSYDHMIKKFDDWSKTLEYHGIISGLNKVVKIDDKVFFLSPWMYKNPEDKTFIDFSMILGFQEYHHQFTDECEEFMINAFQEHGDPDVVVTHTFSHPKGINPLYAEEDNTFYYHAQPYFLQNYMNAKLWVSGHTHASFDFIDNSTRYLCNPRGYENTKDKLENPSFNPNLIVEI